MIARVQFPHGSQIMAQEHKWVWKTLTKLWVCQNCGVYYLMSVAQSQKKKNWKPNPKRKFQGLFCGEWQMSEIHGS